MAGGYNQRDDAVSRLVLQDTVPWYRKPNLRYLYLVMIPTCVGVEMTSGYANIFPDLLLFPYFSSDSTPR